MGQLLHQLHFIPAASALHGRAALMMWMLAVSSKYSPCYSLLMQTASRQINWTVAPSVNSCSVIDNVRAQVPSNNRCPAPAVTSPPRLSAEDLAELRHVEWGTHENSRYL